MVIEDKTRFTVDSFVESSDVSLEDDFMVNGVRFIEVSGDGGGELTWYHVDGEGYVSVIELTDPREFDDANYSFARLAESGEKVMCDDDGVHREWE